jgi:hypothetical protein
VRTFLFIVPIPPSAYMSLSVSSRPQSLKNEFRLSSDSSDSFGVDIVCESKGARIEA